MAAVALRCTSFLAGAFAVALCVSGVLALAGRIAGGELGGGLTLVLAGAVGYVSYLSGRAASRARRRSELERVARRRAVRLVGAATIVTGLGALFVPAPALVKVVGVASAVLVVPVMFARRSGPGAQRRT